ncbi:hypothetical protein RRSWK_05492 [Rhodopirellula sp. SWK7]|nr:hypothetical protein RRSWK_05492 [Rhodopirellula sp. SWK7]
MPPPITQPTDASNRAIRVSITPTAGHSLAKLSPNLGYHPISRSRSQPPHES